MRYVKTASPLKAVQMAGAKLVHRSGALRGAAQGVPGAGAAAKRTVGAAGVTLGKSLVKNPKSTLGVGAAGIAGAGGMAAMGGEKTAGPGYWRGVTGKPRVVRSIGATRKSVDAASGKYGKNWKEVAQVESEAKLRGRRIEKTLGGREWKKKYRKGVAVAGAAGVAAGAGGMAAVGGEKKAEDLVGPIAAGAAVGAVGAGAGSMVRPGVNAYREIRGLRGMGVRPKDTKGLAKTRVMQALKGAKKPALIGAGVGAAVMGASAHEEGGHDRDRDRGLPRGPGCLLASRPGSPRLLPTFGGPGPRG